MPYIKFDPSKMERLNDPARFEQLDPERMWAALGTPAARSIVEIGAGTGLFSSRFAALVPDAVVHAVDTDPEMLRWIRENRPEVAEGRLVPVLSTETGIPLPDASADVVLTINLHHELVDPVAVYTESLRLLRPGGSMLAVDWLPRETPKGPPPGVRVSPERLAGFLADAGFGEVCVHPSLPWHSLVTAVKGPERHPASEDGLSRPG